MQVIYMKTNDPWYSVLEERYGYEYCVKAGYFEEDTPFVGSYYGNFDLPKNKTVIQYSGCFNPFHDGHHDILMAASEYLVDYFPVRVIHVDHFSYRSLKPNYTEVEYQKNIDTLKHCGWYVVEEDKMPNGCSRNFTRLYQELLNNNNEVFFCAGGDRAAFSLSFRDNGKCIIAGRDQDPAYIRYKYLSEQPVSNIKFLPGNNPTSSSEIRSKL